MLVITYIYFQSLHKFLKSELPEALSYIAGGNVGWYNPCGGEFDSI